MTVLVLGADGFLGRHIVDAALARQVDVVSLVRREGDGGRQSLPTAVTRRWFDPETSGPDGVRKMLAELRPRSLINAAGATRGDLVRLADSNVSLVATLVEGLTSGGSQEWTCRLVHVGSGAEYAARPQGTSTGTADLTDPVTPYGVTKLAGTKLVTIAADRGQIDGTVVRVFNPIGPHAPAVGLSGGTVASLSEAIANSRGTLETGDLSAFRDFIDVRDAADLIVAAALKPGPPPPRILNAGTGRRSPPVTSCVRL